MFEKSDHGNLNYSHISSQSAFLFPPQFLTTTLPKRGRTEHSSLAYHVGFSSAVNFLQSFQLKGGIPGFKEALMVFTSGSQEITQAASSVTQFQHLAVLYNTPEIQLSETISFVFWGCWRMEVLWLLNVHKICLLAYCVFMHDSVVKENGKGTWSLIKTNVSPVSSPLVT